jgi:hypothetical protein
MCHPHSSTNAIPECRKKTIKIERMRSQSKYAWRVETGCIRLILYKPSRPARGHKITLTCGQFQGVKRKKEVRSGEIGKGKPGVEAKGRNILRF